MIGSAAVAAGCLSSCTLTHYETLGYEAGTHWYTVGTVPGKRLDAAVRGTGFRSMGKHEAPNQETRRYLGLQEGGSFTILTVVPSEEHLTLSTHIHATGSSQRPGLHPQESLLAPGRRGRSHRDIVAAGASRARRDRYLPCPI